MKKLLYLTLFFTAFANAQIVNIPDANFKAKLIALGVDTNSDGNIQQSEALAQTFLDISGSNISSAIGIESFTNLQILYIHNNLLTSLNVSNLTNLTSLQCHFNQLQNLNIQGCLNLNNFNCSWNHLTSLNLVGTSIFMFNCSNNDLSALNLNVNSIDYFYCNSNLLTTLNLSGISFSQINCSNNFLTSLNLTGTNVSFELDCTNNQLTTIDVSGKHFSNFMCSNNQFTTLDLSTCTNLNILYCGQNPLVTLFVKNGRNESITLPSDSSLQFICADESQITNLQFQAGPNVLISSYCSFVPGGNYNTVSGTIRFDLNNNGCDTNDNSLSNVRVNVNNGTNEESVFTNNLGNYNFYTNTGNYSLTPSTENPLWFNFSPATATITFADTNNNSATQNFCITPNGVHPDLEVAIVPITPARPGFDAVYKIIYKNKGNQALSGNVSFTYNDAVLDFISSSVIPDSQATGSLTWNYTNLQPFESRSFIVILNVNSPTETPAVNIDDVLSFTTTINPVSGDELPLDNVFAFNQIVVGSYDPNDKICLEGDVVSPSKIGDYLHYNINFENTGTAAASFVVVKDMIDTAKIDINTLQIIDSSHPITTRITGNKVEFIFENINLGASQHGNVAFKIKTKSTLVTGNTVTNNANIYFDYNFPITTNTVSTTFQALSNANFVLDNSILISPNPTSSIINIKSDNTINSVELYDVQGRLLQSKIQNKTSVSLDISNQSKGIYFVKINSDKGSKVEKVIKE